MRRLMSQMLSPVPRRRPNSEMSLKKFFPIRHTFVSHRILPRFIILDHIYKKKRMSVWDDLLDLFYVQLLHLLHLHALSNHK